MTGPRVRVVGAEAAADVLAVIHGAFGPRAPLDPPTSALAETLDSVAAELGRVRRSGGRARRPTGRVADLRAGRYGTRPTAGRRTALCRGIGCGGEAGRSTAETQARERAFDGLRVVARVELPGTIRFWEHHGFFVVDREGVNLQMVRVFAHELTTTTREDTQAVAERLAPSVKAGDLLILTGDLGAGKTTFTQGLGRALGVRGDITSPTFVIARTHPSLGAGPPLVHVDAYRLSGFDELDDLDLDTSLEDAVTVVEWGEGLAEGLATDRLEISIRRAHGSELFEDHDPRRIVVQPVGLRWLGALKEL